MAPVEIHDDSWLAEFHAGRRSVVEGVYREHYATVDKAVGRLLSSADKETVVHEVFYRLLARENLRESFRGGSLAAWLTRVATNHAIDHVRRARREEHLSAEVVEQMSATVIEKEEGEAKALIARFREERLPSKWRAVFEARFLNQLPQREAAAQLGMQRTTLVYQEQRIRELLRRFLLKEEG